MIDGVNDEVTDMVDAAENLLLMEGSRVVEAWTRRLAELRDQAAHGEREAANEARNRLRVDAAQSRMRLNPVLTEKWWTGATVEAIAKKYEEAKAWEPIDPSFTAYVERIEAEAKALHDLDPHHLMDKIVPRTESQLVREQTGPMTVDEARAAAMHAPAWYKIHEELATDLTPYQRQNQEKRLVVDMTEYRDSGRLESDSAKLEWARFTNHPAATMVQDENENVDEFHSRRAAMAQEHWDHTVEARREAAKIPESAVGIARPMSVPEAREFMDEFAPEWFRAGHEQIENVQVSEHFAENINYSRDMNDQMRYAMEHLRDTGTMEHSYARSMRDTMELNPDYDTTAGAKPMTMADRVRFGGSELARPLSLDEAKRLVEYAPEWYRKPVMAALEETTMLSESQRAGQSDALVSDMTRLRDHGVLDTDHAMRVWAAQQPSAVDPVWGQTLPVKSIWADTVEARERPAEVPQDVREAVGAGVPGKPRHSARSGVLGVDDHQGRQEPKKEPVKKQERAEVSEKGPGWDSAEARVARARELRSRGFDPDEVKAQMVADWNCASSPGTPGKAQAQGTHHPRRQQSVAREQGKNLSR